MIKGIELSHNQKARNTHIKELIRRGLKPTQENIDNLVIEINELTKNWIRK